MALYKIRQPDGSVGFSDKPPAAGQGDILEVNGRPAGPPEAPKRTQAEKDGDTAKELIAAARKHIPKTAEYLNYLDFLRQGRDINQFNKTLEQLRKSDPKLWLKLQKFPEFRPMAKTLGVIPGGNNILGAAVGVASGSPGSAAFKYFESSTKDLMKSKRYYADVLGAKARMVAPPQVKYSSPGLTAYMDVQGPKTTKALEGSAKALSEARLGVLEAVGTGVSRATGTPMDIMAQLLDAKNAQNIGVLRVDAIYQKLRFAGALDEMQEIDYKALISSGRYKDAIDFLEDADNKFISGKK